MPVLEKRPRLGRRAFHQDGPVSLPTPASLGDYCDYECTTIATDGSAKLDAESGWGFTVWAPSTYTVYEFCGPTILDCSVPCFLGARRHTNNVGEVTALLLAFRWVKFYRVRRATIFYDSEYAAGVINRRYRAKTNLSFVLAAPHIIQKGRSRLLS